MSATDSMPVNTGRACLRSYIGVKIQFSNSVFEFSFRIQFSNSVFEFSFRIQFSNCNTEFRIWILHSSIEFSLHEITVLDSQIEVLHSGLHFCIPNSKTESLHRHYSILVDILQRSQTDETSMRF